ncbi:MAG: PorV/PorQ family protein [Melioribacteraceae bacterium]|nr:PorV/PorQ family protein [Melioribacteraceae bacterium]MCF8353255.1 PorV/PorQ family protein [Melioribacteraceae bacterium]MCF8395569.1 PorV/PorQ family protein [Melioribacteraceae bacterium]MCF8418782.1 PorV/PorQ family protein [Melioribacteraceae bacterium]
MCKFKLANKILLIILLISLQSLFAQNVSKTGTTAASFLEIGVGANAIGMGGAFVSVANDASALYWNAAGIAELQKFEAIVVHTDWIAETNFDFAGLVLPLGDFGTLGFGFTSLSMSDMKVTTVEQPDGTGEFFNASDIAVGISYSRFLTDRFSIGFTFKYIEQRIWHMSSSAFAIDAGTKFRTDLLGGLTIGAAISNFGTPMRLDGRDARYFIRVDENKLGSNERIPTSIEMDTWELPLLFQIGISTYAINNDLYKLMFAADASVPNNNYQSMNLGSELSYQDFIFLRFGYNSLLLEDGEGGLSFGIGMNSKMIFSDAIVNFDYAFRDFGRLQNIHNFSVGIKF